MSFVVRGSWGYFDDDKRVVMFVEGLIGIVAFFGLWASRDFGDEGERSLSIITGLTGMAIGAVLHLAGGDAWWLYH